MAYKSKVLTVSEGGTGATTLTGVLSGSGTSALTGTAITQHNVLVAGASNIISSVAPGASGNVLTSNGTDWTSSAFSSSVTWVINIGPTGSSNPTDGSTYFLSLNVLTTFTASGAGSTRFYFGSSRTITTCYGIAFVAGTLGSSENVSIIIRKNNTSDTTVTSTLQLTSASNSFNNTGLSISLVAGDYIEVKMVNPTWATNPTSVTLIMAIYGT